MTTDNLAEAEQLLRQPDNLGDVVVTDWALQLVLAEYGRRGAALDRTAATPKRVVGENELLREQLAELHTAMAANDAREQAKP